MTRKAKTNSQQEAILEDLAGHSMAAEFVFAPDVPLRTGNEPTDLVWACNNCVILMPMTRSMKEHSDPAKRQRVLSTVYADIGYPVLG